MKIEGKDTHRPSMSMTSTAINAEQGLFIFVIGKKLRYRLDTHATDLSAGSPASGKGTLCKRLARDNDFVHVSVGDVLRTAIASGCRLIGEDDKERIKRSELISEGAVGRILASCVAKAKEDGTYRVIVDGFPRDADQISCVEATIGEPHLVLWFNCDGEIAKQRYLSRKPEGRDEDAALFDTRYAHYLQKLDRIADYYGRQGKLVKINTSGETEASYVLLQQALSGREEWQNIVRY